MKHLELYMHIPFCVRKCAYCDFLSAPADEVTRLKYAEALKKEIEIRSADYKEYQLDTVFVGGGTPTHLPKGKLVELAEAVREFWGEAREFTIECNPGTTDFETFESLKKAGVNRISIGLQSTKNTELERLGRIHSFEEFLRCYEDARRAGFTNINVDLMGALPGQSIGDYEDNLNTVLHLTPRPEHISAYSLIVEEGTPFYDLYEKEQLNVPDEDTEREMYELARQILTKAGYIHYEISNFALPEYECKHNLGYWRRKNYLGLGLGSASLIDNIRYKNTTDLLAYIDDPLQGRIVENKLSKNEQMEEFCFLGLREINGISKAVFESEFHVKFDDIYGKAVHNLIDDGLLTESMGRIALSRRGLDLANIVYSAFLLE